MKGKDLINWIIENHAEDMQVLIEHRDSGGTYRTAEHLGEFQEPMLCSYANESYGVIETIKYNDVPTAILL